MQIIKRIINTDWKNVSWGRIYRAIVRRIVEFPDNILWQLPLKDVKKNNEKLKSFHNKHKGKRCFIVANGPSLQNMDLSLLKNEFTIGMNRIYLLEEIRGFKPTYLAVLDIDVQLEQFAEEYKNYKGIKFFIWNTRKLFGNQPNLMYFNRSMNSNFQADFRKRIGTSKSVTYICIELAYYLGFNEVILIGKDHNYNVVGKPGDYISSNGQEQNHFIKGYYTPGQKWVVPNYQEEEYCYKLAREAYENDGRKILDATISGKLEDFEKVDFNSLFL